MTRVNETAAGRSIGAWVILDKKGRMVAQVHAHYGNRGKVTVDVLNFGDDNHARTAQAMGYTLDDTGRIATFNGKATRWAGEWPYNVSNVQSRSASGYGYDKTTSALSGMVIDGVRLTNHCGERMKRPKGRLWHDSDKARLARKGYTLANWSAARDGLSPEEKAKYGTYGREGIPDSEAGWIDAYRMSGLDVLGAFGYRVLKAI